MKIFHKNMDKESLEKAVEKRYRTRDKRKQPKMRVSGKSVFLLQKLTGKHPENILKKVRKKRV